MDGDATMSIYPIMKQDIVSYWNFVWLLMMYYDIV